MHPPWHALETSVTLGRLDSTTNGLTSAEAARRLSVHGPNMLPVGRADRWWWRLLRQFHNVLLYVMMGAAIITAFLEHWVDTVVLLGAVVINAILGFVQEGRAESALDSIRAMLAPQARVHRDGKIVDIPAAELVPGDVVRLVSGDRVPADLRLIRVRELRVDEAALTGESMPVDKTSEPVEHESDLADRRSTAYAGTVAVFGQGEGVVVATGVDTELGRINALLSAIPKTTTPLLRQIGRFGRWLAAVILTAAAVIYVVGVAWRGESPTEMFTLVVALAASAIPEGLPAIMTVALSLGVQRMARRNAIIRRLPAVETLGSVTVICSDKTGTLTRNEMTVQKVVCAHRTIDVGGVGYAPVGNLTEDDGAMVDPQTDPALRLALRAGVLCNDAKLYEAEGGWQIDGDPTEAALLVLGAKAALTRADADARWPRLDVIPFESEHRFMATLHAGEDESCERIYLKGAPERVLASCTHHLGVEGPVPLDLPYWQRRAMETAGQGLRVLAVAYRDRPSEGGILEFTDAESGFTLLALVGIIDPPREEAIGAVRDCHQAGITVKMITGDHAATAAEIGAQMGLGIGKRPVTGAEIEELDDAALRRVVAETDIFARASPEHKLRLVRALQQDGQIVAMTGDGVNDAPALTRADVGVAMGLGGTEAAKEASDMVLADDNFATIAAAVREGRGVYDNLKKFVLFMLPTNGGEALVVIAAVFFQLTPPLTPAQVLWINLATVSTLGLALAFEPTESSVMRRPPRPPAESLLSGFFVWRVVLVSVLMMTGALGLFLWELESGTTVEVARTLAVNAIVVAEMFYLINSRHIEASVLNRKGLFGSRYVLGAIAACIVLQLLFTYAPLMQTIFGSSGMTPVEWVKVLGVGLVVFFLAEAEKWVLRRRRRGMQRPPVTVFRSELKEIATRGFTMPPRHILVGTDLSESSGEAVRRAAQLAVQHGARLTVLHVLPQGSDAPDASSAASHLRSHTERYAHAVHAETVVHTGAVGSVIIGEIAARGADLLVLGAHGIHGVADALLGGTAESLVRSITIPVLVVKNPPRGPYRRVVLAVDTSEISAEAAHAGTALTPRAEHVLVHVTVVLGEQLLRLHGIDESGLAELRDISTEAVRPRIEQLTAELTPEPIHTVIDSGLPETHIPTSAADHGAELTVIGTGRYSQLGYALLGSVAQHVVRRAESDVLVVPAQASPAGDDVDPELHN